MTVLVVEEDAPVGVPFLDLRAVNNGHGASLDEVWRRILADGRFVGGPSVEAFEAEFARYCRAGHAIGVGNGTDALELILVGLGVGPGDEVVVPANTFVATVEAVCAAGARPRFVDVRPDTLLVDVDAVEAAVGPRTAAVIAVHLFGQMAEMDRLRALTARHDLALVEDAAQAHGAEFDGERAGSAADAAAFSFYPGKNLGALGDAGAVVSDDPELVGRIRSIADHGRSPSDRHRHDHRGRNSRMDALQAALLSVKLPDLDRANACRVAAMERYRRLLPDGVEPVEVLPRARAVHHLAVVRVDDREAVTRRLDAAGIGWRVHYPVPCHRQPAFAEFAGAPMPVAETAAGRILSLPMSPCLAARQITYVCSVLAEE
jgi:dTDP-4-amino-4,6-dideoxygalactose transaminase